MVLEGVRSGENQQPLKEELMGEPTAVSLSDKTGQAGLPNRSDRFSNQLAVGRCQCPKPVRPVFKTGQAGFGQRAQLRF
jgi:hypothetical protein